MSLNRPTATRRLSGVAAALLACAGLIAAAPAHTDAMKASARAEDRPVPAFCVPDPDPPEYYAIELVTTRNIHGTTFSRGTADVTFAPAPFGISVGPDGSYTYDLHVGFENLKPVAGGTYVAWVTTTEVDVIHRLGALDEQQRVSGSVGWNKFLVVVTLEERDDPDAATWSGPIAFRGMSRSGRMHTTIGHGPLQQENCAAYGYAN